MRAVRNRFREVLAALSLVAGVSILIVPPASAGAVINVPASQATIQAGIDAASNGDIVEVAPGTYFEHIDFKGKAVEVRSSAGPATTIIDGGGTNRVVTFDTGEARTSVLRGFTVTHGGTVSTGLGVFVRQASPTIVGNVITGNAWESGSGAGLGVYVEAGSPLIERNQIVDNT